MTHHHTWMAQGSTVRIICARWLSKTKGHLYILSLYRSLKRAIQYITLSGWVFLNRVLSESVVGVMELLLSLQLQASLPLSFFQVRKATHNCTILFNVNFHSKKSLHSILAFSLLHSHKAAPYMKCWIQARDRGCDCIPPPYPPPSSLQIKHHQAKFGINQAMFTLENVDLFFQR